ncbi:MAG: RNA polymerase sigma factor [Actinomycetota bacterium]
MERVNQSGVADETDVRPAWLSFEELFRAEHGRLLRALFLVTGSAQEAEDVMQEAFVRVWDRWDRVRTMNDPVGYLYRTAMNAFRSRYRRAARAAKRVFTPRTRTDEIAAVEDRDEAFRALRSLSPRQREALVLTEYVGYSSEEAGAVMNIRPATVRALAHQGRERLKGSTT